MNSEWLSELVRRWRSQIRLSNAAFPPKSNGTVCCQEKTEFFFFFFSVRQNLHNVLRGEGKFVMSERFGSLVSEAFSRKGLIRIG